MKQVQQVKCSSQWGVWMSYLTLSSLLTRLTHCSRCPLTVVQSIWDECNRCYTQDTLTVILTGALRVWSWSWLLMPSHAHLDHMKEQFYRGTKKGGSPLEMESDFLVGLKQASKILLEFPETLPGFHRPYSWGFRADPEQQWENNAEMFCSLGIYRLELVRVEVCLNRNTSQEEYLVVYCCLIEEHHLRYCWSSKLWRAETWALWSGFSSTVVIAAGGVLFLSSIWVFPTYLGSEFLCEWYSL